MIGIFIGIAAVVSLISLSQGMQDAISEVFVGLGTDKIIVQASGSSFGPPGTAVPVHLTDEDEEVIKKIKGVDLVVGRLIRIVKLDFKNEEKFSYSLTVPSENEGIDLVIEVNDYQILEGKFLDKDSNYETVIGYNMAHGLFEQDIEIRDKINIQDQEFKVVGILKKSGNPQKDDSTILPEKSLRKVLSIGNELDIIPLKVESGEDIFAVSERIKKELRKHRNVEEGKEDFTVQTPGELLNTLTNILLIIQGILVSVAGISLLVGGIGIMNTMYTSVLERTKEIGILKAVGANEKNILLLFLFESGMLGMLGGVIGVILGLSISKSVEYFAYQYYQSQLIQAQISPLLIIGTLLFAFIIGTISGTLPARQAARLNPVDAMRKK